MAEPFLGEIRMFAGNFAPQGWAMCNGQILPIAQNSALFAILGTTYGGNGQTTFALPDLRGRVSLHQGAGPGLTPYTLGESSGVENVTLLPGQMPAHAHSFAPPVSNAAGAAADPTNNFPAAGDANTGPFNYSTTSTGAGGAGVTGTQGGSQPHSNIQPFLCVTFIIALNGIFPSRN